MVHGARNCIIKNGIKKMDKSITRREKNKGISVFIRHNKGYLSHMCDCVNIYKHGSEDLKCDLLGDIMPRSERILQGYFCISTHLICML